LSTQGYCLAESEGNKKLYTGQIPYHPLFKDLNSIIRKFIGVEEVIEKVIDRLGNVHRVYLEGMMPEDLIRISLI
jgi:hypothetical protein